MNLFILKRFEWVDRTYWPGEFVTVNDHSIAQLMVLSQRAAAADPDAARALEGRTARTASAGTVPIRRLWHR